MLKLKIKDINTDTLEILLHSARLLNPNASNVKFVASPKRFEVICRKLQKTTNIKWHDGELPLDFGNPAPPNRSYLINVNNFTLSRFEIKPSYGLSKISKNAIPISLQS